MADTNKISYKDLVDEDGILSGFKSLLEKMKAEITSQVSASGKSLSGNKGTTSSDLKKQAQEIENINTSEKSLIQVEKELLKVQKEKEKLEKQLADASDENVKAKIRYSNASREQRKILQNEIKAAISAEGSYNKLSAQYNLNKIALNAMSEAQRKGTIEGQKLEKETAAIYAEMNNLQKSTGKYVLQVGDYNIASKNVVKSLGDMKKELRELRNISFVGKSPEEVDALKLKIGQLMDSMGDLKGEMKVLGTENAEILLSGLKLISAGVEGVVGTLSILGVESETIKKLETKMTSLIAVTHALSEIEDTIASGKAKAMLFRIKDMALKTAETVKTWALTAAQTAYNVVVGTSTGLLKGFRLALAATGIGAIALAIYELTTNWDSLTKSIGVSKNAVEDFNKEMDSISEEGLKTLIEETEKLTQKTKLLTLEYKKANKEITDEQYNLAVKGLEIADDYQTQYYTIAFEANKKLIQVESARAEAISRLQQSSFAGSAENLAKQKEVNQKAAAATAEIEKQKWKLLKAIQENNTKENQIALSNYFESTKKDKEKETKEVIKNNVDQSDSYEKLIAKISEYEKMLNAAIIDNKPKLINALNEYLKSLYAQKEAVDLLKKSFTEARDKGKIFNEERSTWTEKYLAKIEEEKIADEKKKSAEKELYDTIEETTTSIIESYKKRSEAKEENLNKELEASKEYESQLRELAKRGIEGATENLAFEQKAQAEIEKKKLAEQKKQKRLELGMSAISAFGKIAETEPEQALTKTITEITKLLAFINSLPAFSEGVIEFKGKGTTKSDSNLVRLSDKESVIKAEATEMYKPQLKAMNELRYNPFDYIKLPSNDGMQNNVSDYGVINELKELKEITKNKTEYKIDINGLTHEIVERVTKGNTTIINKHKPKGLF